MLGFSVVKSRRDQQAGEISKLHQHKVAVARSSHLSGAPSLQFSMAALQANILLSQQLQVLVQLADLACWTTEKPNTINHL